MPETKWPAYPWHIHAPGVINAGNDTIATVTQRYRSAEEIQAITDLIVAAPDLYDALLLVLDFEQTMDAEDDCGPRVGWIGNGEIEPKVRAALAKARGEQP